ncbi:DUF1707 domain-containing protein [Nocardia sp. CC201C]|uniref:DUF1707 SHOCT-like domain-containing protein n=1 Tax=Nocardia sp. CC201C TaxID=3044575 RepID=UPI0024A8CAE5|nr:DUF1707 domain-containing protein [Nocardia sp. CC201C]
MEESREDLDMDIASGTRASDAERAAVIEQLGRHMAEGRITTTEYDERAAQVYATPTREGLHVVLADLPELAKTTVRQRTPRIPVWQRIEGSAWFGVGLLCLAIWAMISIAAGEPTYFWPFWVIVPWGGVLVFRMLTGWESSSCGRHPRAR